MNTNAPVTRTHDCRTIRAEDCAALLGIGRSAAYALVRNAYASGGDPFSVVRIGKSLLVSRKSFSIFLENNGL